MTTRAAGKERIERPLPWEAAHLFRVCAALVGAAVALLVSWWGVSGTARMSTQIAWVNLGVAALILIAATMGMWLLAGRREVGRLQASITASLEAVLVDRVRAPSVASAPDPADKDALVSGVGMTLYHRPTCQLVAGKPVTVATRRSHEVARRRPCRVCLEDQQGRP